LKKASPQRTPRTLRIFPKTVNASVSFVSIVVNSFPAY
jgi:hypothetical protein